MARRLALAPALRRRALARFSVRGELARRIATFPRARDPWLRAVARARGRGAIDTLLGPLPDEELFALYAWAPPPLRRRVVRYAVEDRPRRAPVNGGDLAALGLSGPTLGRVLAQLRVAYLDGLIRNREEALIQATELGRRRRASSKGRPA